MNSSSPPYFNGQRGVTISYGMDGPELDLLDQWVMWAPSRTWKRPPKAQPHWNYGACISYVQLMKTMLAIAGINSQRAWLYPKTTQWPNGEDVDWDDSDLLDLEDRDPDVEKYRIPKTTPQEWPFADPNTKLMSKATVRLIEKPGPHGTPFYEAFEACLYYDGKLVPGAIPPRRYPPDVLHDRVGFANAKELLRWWHSVKHGDFKRFMAWVSESPLAFFDKDGTYYSSPYKIPVSKQLPVP